MSEDPKDAIDEVIFKIDEAMGDVHSPCSGWLKKAPMDEVINWLRHNIRMRLGTISNQLSSRRITSNPGDSMEDFYVVDMGDGMLSATRSKLRVLVNGKPKCRMLTRRELYKDDMGRAECAYCHEFMCGAFPAGDDPERPSKDEWLDMRPYPHEVDEFLTRKLFGGAAYNGR